MGKDWYRGSGAKTASASNSSKRAAAATAQEATPTGCINAVFHLFDFHHFQFPLNHQTTSSTSTSSCSCLSFKQPQSPFLSSRSTLVPTSLKGTEAPRNSFESEEESSTFTSASASVSLTSTSKAEENLYIPMGIQIKTGGSKAGVDTSSEISSSPGDKTPTLVARLMGLDILPESHSPSFSSTTIQAKSHLKPLHGDIRGTRSLPESPRISSARRSDVDYHHRFSLQINRDNTTASEESVISRLKALKRKELKHEDENRSPGHYTRQIAKQVKESVSRKAGLMDITNTVRNREQAREELVSHFKNKKTSRALTKVAEDPSPKLRFSEPKTKDNNIPQQPPNSSSSSSAAAAAAARPQSQPKLMPVAEEPDELQKKPPRAISKCKKLRKPQQTSDIIRDKKEEPFVRPSTANRVHIHDKKCKKTPLSNYLLNITVKKYPSPPATKIPQKQVLDAGRPKRSSQLYSCYQTYNKQEATYVHISPHDNIGDRCNDTTHTTTEYHEYISPSNSLNFLV